MDEDHVVISKKFEEEVKSFVKTNVVKRITKNNLTYLELPIYFIWFHSPFQKGWTTRKRFLGRFGTINNQKPFFNVICWKHVAKTKQFAMHLCSRFSQEILLGFVGKCKYKCVLPLLEDCISITTSFDMWMYHGMRNVFVLQSI